MIAVDTSILVHAHNATSPLQAAAHSRLNELAGGYARWAIPLSCMSEFYRIVTHRRVFARPMSIDEAVGSMASLLSAPSATLLYPSKRFPGLLAEAMSEADARGNLVFDAQIVALCRDAGVTTLLTQDRDFLRFKDLKIETLSP